jgi:hypothetical protein
MESARPHDVNAEGESQNSHWDSEHHQPGHNRRNKKST